MSRSPEYDTLIAEPLRAMRAAERAKKAARGAGDKATEARAAGEEAVAKTLLDHAFAEAAQLVGKRPLTPEDLTYSAGARCQCGAGLAYPDLLALRAPLAAAWRCSAVLLGETPDGSGHDVLPFACWDVKSEGHWRTPTASTRPGGVPLKSRMVELQAEAGAEE